MKENLVEARITELETRLSYQDRLMDELNEVVTRQQDQIDRLVRELKGVREHLKGQQGSGLARPDEEAPPPHY